ncbi:MAG: precorrin-6y C5,15-methyltransferase (decarboxylating) subunit CbiE [Verrucomicrobiota bacterium]
MSGHLTVLGCGVEPADCTDRHRQVVKTADILAGGQRLLAWFPEFEGERVCIGARAADTARDLATRAETERVVVLASGDPLFFGIARLFLPLMPSEALTILPNCTAAQAALARLHMPWAETRFFSVHGRSFPLPWDRILRSPSAVVYGDRRRTPATIAAELVEQFPPASRRRAAILDSLGGEEKITEGTLAELTGVSCTPLSLLVLRENSEISCCPAPCLPLGQPDDEFDHERGLITHPEIRAVVLAKLRLRPGVLWDLGAGSGSVGVEAAGLCEHLAVFAVEGKQQRCEQIRQNASAAGRNKVEVIHDDILAAIPQIPAPDSVFVGGGGAKVSEIVEQAFRALRPGGVLVATAVMEETRTALMSTLPETQPEVLEIAIRRRTSLGPGHRMNPENPIHLITFVKDGEKKI